VPVLISGQRLSVRVRQKLFLSRNAEVMYGAGARRMINASEEVHLPSTDTRHVSGDSMSSAVILAADWMVLGLCKQLSGCHHLFVVRGVHSCESKWNGPRRACRWLERNSRAFWLALTNWHRGKERNRCATLSNYQ